MLNLLPFGGNFSPIWENQNQKKAFFPFLQQLPEENLSPHL
jgi:hypothetical protein